MVLTTAPAFTGGAPAEGEEKNHAQVAMVGQVPVNVLGTVAAGDFVVASGRGDGTAVGVAPEKLEPGQYGLVLGRAIDASANGQVLTMIGLPSTTPVTAALPAELTELRQLVVEQSQLIDLLTARLEKLETAAGTERRR
ncbi:MAG: hypothetical protein AAF533_10755 [Acidobacteriota bacterium]